MKTFCAWLLLLFAVLVPATAAVMAPVFSPPASATKQAQLRAQSHADKAQARQFQTRHREAQASGALSRTTAKAGGHARRGSGIAHPEHCADCAPCSQCTACGPAGSMVAAWGEPLLPGPGADLLAPRPADGRAQFISGGQYRPPRSA